MCRMSYRRFVHVYFCHISFFGRPPAEVACLIVVLSRVLLSCVRNPLKFLRKAPCWGGPLRGATENSVERVPHEIKVLASTPVNEYPENSGERVPRVPHEYLMCFMRCVCSLIDSTAATPTCLNMHCMCCRSSYCPVHAFVHGYAYVTAYVYS